MMIFEEINELAEKTWRLHTLIVFRVTAALQHTDINTKDDLLKDILVELSNTGREGVDRMIEEMQQSMKDFDQQTEQK